MMQLFRFQRQYRPFLRPLLFAAAIRAFFDYADAAATAMIENVDPDMLPRRAARRFEAMLRYFLRRCYEPELLRDAAAASRLLIMPLA